MTELTVNGSAVRIHADPATPLLWVLRDELGLLGTKYGCGVGVCGICTVLLDGSEATRACTVSVAELEGRSVTTIEGLAGDASHPLVRAWITGQVPQCGYCQPGQLLAAAALLAARPRPDDADIDHALAGVLCRCGSYQRVRRAIHVAARGDTLAVPDAALLAGPPPARPYHPPAGPVFAPNPWVEISPDGTVTVIIDRSEMGQGALTGLAMLVAEELEVDVAQVHTAFAPADPRYDNPLFGEQATGGSTSLRGAWEPLRRAGAEAREMLIRAAADAWGVPLRDCRAERGTVLHMPSGRLAGYGSLTGRAAQLSPPTQVSLKPPRRWRVLGHSTPRLEIPAMVQGRTQYGIDAAPPGTLVATVVRCPSFGGHVRRFDARAAEQVPGVRRVLEIASGVAVVAEHFPAALRGREALQVQWAPGPLVALDDAAVRARLRAAAGRPGSIAQSRGGAERFPGSAPRLVEAIYEVPYLAHGCMEPMNCAARVAGGRCELWVPTQAQGATRATAARVAGVPLECVEVHSTFLGGGFGRRAEQDVVEDAVALSRALGLPVQVIFTRQDDLQHDYYRPASCTWLRAALDGNGRLLAWWQRIAGPSMVMNGVDMPYTVPQLREERVEEDPGVPTGAWRSVGASQHAFSIEGFIDELAHAAGAEPLAFRLALLAEAPRHRAVLQLAAERAGWARPAPAGRHRGVAVYRCYEGWVAEIAEVSVAADGELRVHRVVCAVDCGRVINPDSVIAQVEGGVAMGLSAALKEAVMLRDGAVQQSSFRDYPILTIAEMPQVEVYIVPSHAPPGGVGEPAVPPVAPAVANAIFAATGERLRSLPLRPAAAPSV